MSGMESWVRVVREQARRATSHGDTDMHGGFCRVPVDDSEPRQGLLASSRRRGTTLVQSLSILEAIDVWKECGTGNGPRIQALRGVSLRIEPGEFVAVMGPSGCGKSTLLHVLGGIDSPTAGRVLLDGADFGALTDTARSVIRRRRLGFVFQKMNLLPTLSAIENVALPLRIDGVPPCARKPASLEALSRVDIEKRTSHLPQEMSGGEQQRVAIARALVINPAVLLADEPTGALDSINSAAIRRLLRAHADRGQTVVMVTHDPAMAADADRVLAMCDGEMVPTFAASVDPAPAEASLENQTTSDFNTECNGRLKAWNCVAGHPFDRCSRSSWNDIRAGRDGPVCNLKRRTRQ